MVKTLLKYHILAFNIGIILDLIIGDPHFIPHPIRAIGNLIHLLENLFIGNNHRAKSHKKEKLYGILTVIIVMAVSAAGVFLLLMLSLIIGYVPLIVTEAVFTAYFLAPVSLYKESMKVYKDLERGSLEDARNSVSMIVGRDTKSLDEKGVIKATVETVAENFSDAVVSPLFYMFFGGPVLGVIFKSVSTMDSMIGYHTDRYEYFGKCAARLDDYVNYIPSRIAAVFLVFAACIDKKTSGRAAFRIYKRDRYNHKSPNSAQTESVVAGAMNISLAGDAYYFGKLVSKPTIGDEIEQIKTDNIKTVNRLMFEAYFLLIAILELLFLACLYIIR